MRRSRLQRKLVTGVLALFLVPTLLAGAVLWWLHGRGVFEEPRALGLTVVIGFVAMMTYLGAMTHSIGRSLVATLHEIQRGTELMATVNPEHRLAIRTGDEMEHVAQAINRMADQVRQAQQGLEREVALATRERELERRTLAAILADVDEAVVAAGMDGTITLANGAAERALGGGRGRHPSRAPCSTGRGAAPRESCGPGSPPPSWRSAKVCPPATSCTTPPGKRCGPSRPRRSGRDSGRAHPMSPPAWSRRPPRSRRRGPTSGRGRGRAIPSWES